MDSEEDSFQTYHPIYFTDNQNGHNWLLVKKVKLSFIILIFCIKMIHKHIQGQFKAKQQKQDIKRNKCNVY